MAGKINRQLEMYSSHRVHVSLIIHKKQKSDRRMNVTLITKNYACTCMCGCVYICISRKNNQECKDAVHTEKFNL